MNIKEIYEVRTALEISALRLASARGVEAETVDQLINLCGAMDQLLKADLYFGYSEADAKFHTLLVQLSGNRRLVRVYSSAPLPHAKCGGVLPDDIDQVLQKAQNEHQEMCRCVSEGRILDAIPVIEEHLSVDWWLSDCSGNSTDIEFYRYLCQEPGGRTRGERLTATMMSALSKQIPVAATPDVSK
jgi:DNA-binding GntR family transcriptional regulator